MTEQLLNALITLADIKLLVLIIVGVTIGMVGGGLPGISATVTLALSLPFAFTLPPVESLIILGAIYMSAEYGGSISAILINTPGTPAAVCTGIDGYPMARQGRAKEALQVAILASSIGGVIGALILIFFTPVLADLALKFGSPELFWLAIAGLAMVANLTADDFIKGVIATLIGLTISTIGFDLASGYPRFSFGIPYLAAGISLLPALIGFFALTEMFVTILKMQGGGEPVASKPSRFIDVVRYFFARPLLVLQSSFIGTAIGILPGAGASIASFVSYAEAKRFAKEPDELGKGNPEGIIASETANNAMVGGSLIPLLSFGIPGSGSAAVLFGAITLHGLVPGPRLFTEYGDTIFSFMVGFLPICLAMLIVGTIASPLLASVLRTRMAFIVPSVLFLVLIGTYSFGGTLLDTLVAGVTGLLGLFLITRQVKLPPIVLGLLLGPMIEESFRRSVQLGEIDGSIWLMFFGRPISVVLILMTAGIILSAIWKEAKSRKLAENK